MATVRTRVNLATAKVIPTLLTLFVGYASYVITGPLVIEYLLNPPNSTVRQRLAAGIAIPIVYYFLLVLVTAAWIRLLVSLWYSPGYVELGECRELPENEPAPGLEAIYEKDVFVCDAGGLPIWCQHCATWKPDRAHHSQDAGRCSWKMDHFCPWVGGVVGERSYKFFMQFLFWSCVLCAYSAGCLAYFVSERHRNGLGKSVQWIVVLSLAGFFCFFTAGMVLTSLWMVFRNRTTIENIDYQRRTMFVAVALPPELQAAAINGMPVVPNPAKLRDDSPSAPGHDGHPISSDIDDPSHSNYFNNLSRGRRHRRSSIADQIWQGTITFPLHLPTDRPPLPAPRPKTFAILRTLPGMNVWDLGSAWLNFQAVFGSRPHEWLFPLSISPCCDHSSMISQYPLGPDFEELLNEVGLNDQDAAELSWDRGMSGTQQSKTSRQKRMKRRLDAGWQNGERPDGWISEKEARRARNYIRWQNLENGQRHDR